MAVWLRWAPKPGFDFYILTLKPYMRTLPELCFPNFHYFRLTHLKNEIKVFKCATKETEKGGRILLGDNMLRDCHVAADLVSVCWCLDFNSTSICECVCVCVVRARIYV